MYTYKLFSELKYICTSFNSNSYKYTYRYRCTALNIDVYFIKKHAQIAAFFDFTFSRKIMIPGWLILFIFMFIFMSMIF